MPRETLQPDELFPAEPYGFSQVVRSQPGRLVFVSGQVAWDRECQLVGGSDLAAQAEQALQNLDHALTAAGATHADVTMVRVYVVDYRPEYAGILGPLFQKFFAGGKPPASTWVGVASLALPDFRIEIEAVAVLPA